MTRGVFTETIPTQIELQLIVAAWFLDQCGYDLASPILVELVGEILRPKSRRTALGAMNTSQPKFSIPVDAVEPAAFRQFVSPFVALVHLAPAFKVEEVSGLFAECITDGDIDPTEALQLIQNLAPLIRQRGQVSANAPLTLLTLLNLCVEDGDSHLAHAIASTSTLDGVPALWERYRIECPKPMTVLPLEQFEKIFLWRVGASPDR